MDAIEKRSVELESDYRRHRRGEVAHPGPAQQGLAT